MEEIPTKYQVNADPKNFWSYGSGLPMMLPK